MKRINLTCPLPIHFLLWILFLSPVQAQGDLEVDGSVIIGGTAGPGIIELVGNNSSLAKYGAMKMVDLISESNGSDKDDLLLEAAGGIFFRIDNNGNGISGDHGFSVFKDDTHLFEIKQNGQVLIGTNQPATNFKLSVDGKIASEEVLVELSGSWPDYVFKPEYQLLSLNEVEDHIATKGHLPGIPSAREIEAQGVHIGEMNRILVEKIEELTLYLLQHQQQIDQQQKQIDELLHNQQK